MYDIIFFTQLSRLVWTQGRQSQVTYDKPIQQVLVEMTDGGLDYTFECTWEYSYNGKLHLQ